MSLKAIAEKAGLQWDGAADGSLHLDSNPIHVYAQIMTEDEYDRMEAEIADAEIKGKGYKVYAWNDCSGYSYWHADGDSNYIQVSAIITKAKLVDPKQLRADMDRLQDRLCHWHNVDSYYAKKTFERG